MLFVDGGHQHINYNINSFLQKFIFLVCHKLFYFILRAEASPGVRCGASELPRYGAFILFPPVLISLTTSFLFINYF